MHEELAGADGCVSAAKVVESQPSFRQPMERGLKYTVIAHELAEACPGLMRFLAITGNADHHTARVATTIQRLKRVYMIARSQPSFPKLTEEAWARVKSLATIGMPADFKADIDSYLIGLRRPPPRPT